LPAVEDLSEPPGGGRGQVLDVFDNDQVTRGCLPIDVGELRQGLKGRPAEVHGRDCRTCAGRADPRESLDKPSDQMGLPGARRAVKEQNWDAAPAAGRQIQNCSQRGAVLRELNEARKEIGGAVHKSWVDGDSCFLGYVSLLPVAAGRMPQFA